MNTRPDARMLAVVLICCGSSLAAGRQKPPAGEQHAITLRVSVTDPRGQALAGAQVASDATIVNGRLELRGAVRTDRNGTASLKVPDRNRHTAVWARDAEGRRGAVKVILPRDYEDQLLVLQVQPVGCVKLTIQAPPIAYETPGSVSIWLHDSQLTKYPILNLKGLKKQQQLWLPAGKYELSVFNFATRIPDPVPFEVHPEDAAEVKVRLEPTRIVRLAGQAPPDWHVLAARGLARDVQPKDFRGRWLLLEFWGFW